MKKNHANCKLFHTACGQEVENRNGETLFAYGYRTELLKVSPGTYSSVTGIFLSVNEKIEYGKKFCGPVN